MKNRLLRRLTMLTGLLLLCGIFSLSAEEMKALRVGLSPISPPTQYRDKTQIVGLEVDFAEQLGKELKRKVVLVDLKFAQLIPSLLDGSIDIIMSGMSITQVRGLQVAFADPYMQISQMPLVRLEDANKYILPLDVIMTDKNVGATENTTSQFLLVQDFPNAKKRFYISQDAAIGALKKKKIDLLILDSTYVAWLAMKNEGKVTSVPIKLTQENLAWGVNKNNAALLESVNTILANWKETGQLDATIKKWVPGFN